MLVPIKTEWVVLTGPPCSGKTTVLNKLKDIGYNTSPDISREVISQHITQGKTSYEVRENQKYLQNEILQRMLETESKLKKSELIFLDYALPDNIAFCETAGIYLKSIWSSAKKYQYNHIIMFESLPLINDEIRIENRELQKKIYQLLVNTYRSLGYDIFFLDAIPVNQRVQNILTKVDPDNKLIRQKI